MLINQLPAAWNCVMMCPKSAEAVMQVAKHTPELAQLVVGAGGVGALVDYVGATKGNTRLPGIMALGYIAAFSETLGLSVIAEKGLVSLQTLVVFMVHKTCVSAHDFACLQGYC